MKNFLGKAVPRAQAAKWLQGDSFSRGLSPQSQCPPGVLQWDAKGAGFVPKEPISLRRTHVCGQYSCWDSFLLLTSWLGASWMHLGKALWMVMCGWRDPHGSAEQKAATEMFSASSYTRGGFSGILGKILLGKGCPALAQAAQGSGGVM